MKIIAIGALCASATLIACTGMSSKTSTSAAPVVPAAVSAAVADASRPDADKARDVNRKPAAVLAFAGVKPGDKVGELMAGGGYYTRLLCKVVGEKGHVYTMSVTPAIKMDRPPPDAPRAGPPPAPAQTSGVPCTNVTADSKLAAQFALPPNLDLVWTTENYHDLHNAMMGKPDMVAFDRAIFAALKPGGVFIVEDHAAAAGSGVEATDTLHRIDAEQVKKEVTAAGFVFEASSTLLANPEDAHTEAVFKLGGKSDKFLLRFRKPKK